MDQAMKTQTTEETVDVLVTFYLRHLKIVLTDNARGAASIRNGTKKLKLTYRNGCGVEIILFFHSFYSFYLLTLFKERKKIGYTFNYNYNLNYILHAANIAVRII